MNATCPTLSVSQSISQIICKFKYTIPPLSEISCHHIYTSVKDVKHCNLNKYMYYQITRLWAADPNKNSSQTKITLLNLSLSVSTLLLQTSNKRLSTIQIHQITSSSLILLTLHSTQWSRTRNRTTVKNIMAQCFQLCKYFERLLTIWFSSSKLNSTVFIWLNKHHLITTLNCYLWSSNTLKNVTFSTLHTLLCSTHLKTLWTR